MPAVFLSGTFLFLKDDVRISLADLDEKMKYGVCQYKEAAMHQEKIFRQQMAGMRSYVEDRFANVGRCNFDAKRGSAHSIVDSIENRNFSAAKEDIRKKLSPVEAVQFRKKLRYLGVDLDKWVG